MGYCTRFIVFQFLLFPEGTDLTATNVAKSGQFAEKHGLPVYRHVLHPRTTGFVHFVNTMNNSKSGKQDIIPVQSECVMRISKCKKQTNNTVLMLHAHEILLWVAI